MSLRNTLLAAALLLTPLAANAQSYVQAGATKKANLTQFSFGLPFSKTFRVGALHRNFQYRPNDEKQLGAQLTLVTAKQDILGGYANISTQLYKFRNNAPIVHPGVGVTTKDFQFLGLDFNASGSTHFPEYDNVFLIGSASISYTFENDTYIKAEGFAGHRTQDSSFGDEGFNLEGINKLLDLRLEIGKPINEKRTVAVGVQRMRFEFDQVYKFAFPYVKIK